MVSRLPPNDPPEVPHGALRWWWGPNRPGPLRMRLRAFRAPHRPGPTPNSGQRTLRRMHGPPARRSPSRLPGPMLRNKWKVLERVGSGSFGTVYKVQDVKGGWIDALKILSVDRLVGMDAEHARKRFLREAQLVKRLGKDSQHIVGLSTYEEDLEAGLIYFLMDFVEGESLGEIVRSGGPFTPQRAVRLALQVCDALMVAHEGAEPVVHRDLKLENIMLTRGRGGEEIAKVLDFGIAKIAEREQDSRLTEAGTSLGTPGFAAPEQLRAGAVDGRTDLFAFGVILYTILTGKDPWLGDPAGASTGKIYELMVASERGEVRPIEETGVEVPPALAEIVLKLLRRDPEERFPSARELKLALEAVPLPSSASVRETARARQPRKPVTRKIPAGLAAGALGTLLVVALLLARPWGRTMDLPDLQARASRGGVTQVRLTSTGIRGSSRALGLLPAPFKVPLPEGEMPRVVEELRAAGVEVDASWELNRLLERAERAQAEMRYFDYEGDDVRGYAERMAALEPESPEARSLLLKVAERMAWDAEAAFQAGSTGVAQNLLRECRAIVPNHPRCEAAAAGG
jgi:serine/threonine protein kinase